MSLSIEYDKQPQDFLKKCEKIIFERIKEEASLK